MDDVVYQDIQTSHLPVIDSIEQAYAFNFSPDIVWIFDLDRHGFWWGNDKALAFWGLTEVQQLIDKDLSADTEGARKRTEQTFVKAALEGQTQDPWTTYPNGQPKVMSMRHVAVLLGPEKRRGLIAFISEQIDCDGQPENLLFAEAVRYTSVSVSCYSLEGKRLFENPAFTRTYGNKTGGELSSDFEIGFESASEAASRIAHVRKKQEGSQEHLMNTLAGIRRHNVDIRNSRHPITGDYIFLVTEYDVTELHDTIEELESTKDELKKLAHYDSLTKLPTTFLTKERLQSAMLHAAREQSLVGVMFMDLDGFKDVNDCYGHGAGDELLILVAKRLTQSFRASDTVGRLGGDEFLVCLPDLTSTKDALQLASKAVQEVAREYTIEDDQGQLQVVNISVSIGIAFYPNSGMTAEDLIREADQKMYQAKREGKNQYAC